MGSRGVRDLGMLGLRGPGAQASRRGARSGDVETPRPREESGPWRRKRGTRGPPCPTRPHDPPGPRPRVVPRAERAQPPGTSSPRVSVKSCVPWARVCLRSAAPGRHWRAGGGVLGPQGPGKPRVGSGLRPGGATQGRPAGLKAEEEQTVTFHHQLDNLGKEATEASTRPARNCT